MDLFDFKVFVKKALHYGFQRFNLTPHIGETLADLYFLKRLEFLESLNEVRGYYFSTNFSVAKHGHIEYFNFLKKLESLSISIYGHNPSYFEEITQAKPSFYDKIVHNLQILYEFDELCTKTEIKIRTIKDFELDNCDSDICTIIKKLKDKGVRVRIPKEFSNWSGIIEDKELIKKSLTPKQPEVERKAPCVFLFYKPVLLPDGSINACSAGDGNLNFIIGNLNNEDFRDIFSNKNKKFMDLIEAHLQGNFDGICKSCSDYRSIAKHWHSYDYHKKPQVNLEEFLDKLSKS